MLVVSCLGSRYTHMHTCTYCMNASVHSHEHACTHTHVCAHTLYTCMHMQCCVHTHTHTHTHRVQVHTYWYTFYNVHSQVYKYTHTHTRMIWILLLLMRWSCGQDTGSGVSQKVRPQQAEVAIRFYCTSADNFQHTQNPHSHAWIREQCRPQETRYRYNQTGPLDHKMAYNCVSLACANTWNTVSSTIFNN